MKKALIEVEIEDKYCWLAQDSCGATYAHIDKPELADTEWESCGGLELVSESTNAEGWTTSLRALR